MKAERRTSPAKKTVLSVEDSDAIRSLIRMTLEFDGFTVLEANSGADGMQKVLLKRPDLILLDVKMPGISGIELCTKLQADPYLRKIPVVMLSGHDDRELVDAAIAAGAKTYLTKPFVPLALIELVHRLIKDSHKQRTTPA
jgi:two-component system, OmpR family, phosphate regulon response regulator PhoB